VVERGSGDRHLFPQVPRLGNLEEGPSTEDFERRIKGALGMQYLSLKRLCGGGLGGELLHWGPRVGNVVLRKRPPSIFGVSVKP
jgi:hypothetical protein